ncbi:MAG TPA: hypothetical protein VMP00_03295, partial [Burkholderiales bacterium]|nr:hypothetical protein [Burkholderiales bacterium]
MSSKVGNLHHLPRPRRYAGARVQVAGCDPPGRALQLPQFPQYIGACAKTPGSEPDQQCDSQRQQLARQDAAGGSQRRGLGKPCDHEGAAIVAARNLRECKQPVASVRSDGLDAPALPLVDCGDQPRILQRASLAAFIVHAAEQDHALVIGDRDHGALGHATAERLTAEIVQVEAGEHHAVDRTAGVDRVTEMQRAFLRD